MNRILFLSTLVAMFGSACSDNADVEPGSYDAQGQFSKITHDTSGEHEFLVTLTPGAAVDDATVGTMLQNLELLPRAEAFPDLDPAVLFAPELERGPIEDDEIDVQIVALDDGVNANDYAWRAALRTPAGPSAGVPPEGELGTAQQPQSFDVLPPPNTSHNTPAISCNLVSLTWSTLGGGGTVCLQNLTDGTQECRSATALIKQLTGASFPTKKKWRARLIANSSGLAVKGDLLCL